MTLTPQSEALWAIIGGSQDGLTVHMLERIEAAAATRERKRLGNLLSDYIGDGAQAERKRITDELRPAMHASVAAVMDPDGHKAHYGECGCSVLADAYLAHPAVRAILEPKDAL